MELNLVDSPSSMYFVVLKTPQGIQVKKMIKKIYRFLSPKFQTLFLDYKVDMRPRYGHGKPPHTKLYDIVNANRVSYEALLEKTLSFVDNIHQIKKRDVETDVSKPSWNNDFLPGLDIIGIYAMLAIYQPKRYVEVGSGNSTKVAYKAKIEHKLTTEIVSIDPHPRAEIDQLADIVIRKPFEDIDYNEILALEANDILFIDNSHRILPNSDSMVFFYGNITKFEFRSYCSYS